MQTKQSPGRQAPKHDEKEPLTVVAWPPGLSWRQLLTGSAAHVGGAIVLGVISMLVIPPILDPERSLEITFLSDPPVEELPVDPPSKPVDRKPVPKPEPRSIPTPPEPVILVPKPPEPVEPTPKEPPQEAPPEPKAKPKPEVRLERFARNDTAPAPPKVAVRSVQTGGFGDPEGVPSKDETKQPGARERLGSFDLPAGPGQGNGAGGAKGTARAVASGGFGDSAAVPSAGSGVARGAVRPGGFAETSAPPPAPRPKPRVEAALTQPVEIVNRPRPAYTEEARHRHIEGEVVLEVLFTAAGRPQVLRVVSGLGSGLDESAMRAAEQISFKPALRDGRPVDYTAIVRILFQLT